MARHHLFVPRALCAAFVPSFVLVPGLLAQAPAAAASPSAAQQVATQQAATQQAAAQQDPAAKPATASNASTALPPGQAAGDPPIVVTASRRAQDPFEAPRAIDVVSSQDIQQYQFRSTPQALRYLPSAMIQETSPGQGSPFLRGFTGYNNLLLIDGIRLNNSTFRSGPNQYWATVDPLSLDRIEVLRGPASTQWGSDAVGGTVQAITKGPTLYGKDGVRYGGANYGRYATAEDSPMARGEAQATWTREGGRRSGALIGGDARAIGDIEGGKDTGIQPNTAHKETAFDVKVEHELSAHSKLVVLHQQMAQTDVPRTHATVFGESWRGTTVGTDQRRDLDQDRRLSYVQLHQTDLDGALSAARWSLSWQTQNENQDRVTGAGQARAEAFEVGTFGAFAQFESDLGAAGTLTYGVDYYRDNVNSWSRGGGSNLFQGPVGNDAKYDLFGAFVQDELDLGGGLSAQAGVRYTYAAADADSVRSPTSATTGIAVKQDWDEVTANVHLRQELTERWNVYGGASQGFRAPSLSDLTSFTVARSGEQEIASPDLDAERYLGYEVGTKVRTGAVQTQLAWYWTDIEDQIIRTPTGTTVGGLPAIAKSNAGDGYIQGTEVQVSCEVVERTTAFVVNSWQYGRVDGFDANRNAVTDYPSRLMPMTTIVGIKWDNAAGDFHCGTDVLRAEDADRLSQGDQADTQRIPPGGTPSYTLWNLRCGFRLDERATLELACENVTDVDYRVHGSGSNGLGRNFIVGMAVTF
jgi:hemoglobin/transferrin/lactoferrin receptor protein